MKSKKTGINYISVLLSLFLVLIYTFPATAFERHISSGKKFVWSENAGWINFQPSNGGVLVHESYLSGFAWSENVGWIKLGVDGGGPYGNSNYSNWGVNLSTSGELSGYAWSEVAGWVNFNPTHSQVMINDYGYFSGYAWSENIGWIKFKKETAPEYVVLVASKPPLNPVVDDNGNTFGWTSAERRIQ